MSDILQSRTINLYGRPIVSYQTYKRFIFARLLSFIISILALCSLILAVHANEPAYGVLMNAIALSLPIGLHYSQHLIRLEMSILRFMSQFGTVAVVVFIIINAVMISEHSKTYRYCYGDLTDSCYQDEDDGPDSYDCRTEFDSTAHDYDDLISVNCTTSRHNLVFLIAALIINFANCFVMIPMLLAVSAICDRLYRQYLLGLDLSDDFEVCAKASEVIIKEGLPLPTETEFTCIGVPFEGGKELISRNP
jgi:hypothetical protein